MRRRLTSRAGLVLVVTAIILRFVLNAAQIQAASAPARGGRVLRLARPTDPQTLDPALTLMQSDIVLLPLLNIPLLDVVEGTRLRNGAAREWSVSADARTYTLELCPELKFSNGQSVVAADYVYAFERMLDPRTACPVIMYVSGIRGAKDFLNARGAEGERTRLGNLPSKAPWLEPTKVAGLRAPGPHTLVIELEQPDPTFAYVLAFPMEVAVPQKEVERGGPPFGVRPVGNGPYLVQEWVRGARLVLAPNPHYAGREPRHFERIEIMIGGDPSTHLMMFERGELDITDIENFYLPLPDHLRLMRHPVWRSCVERSACGYTSWIFLNTEMRPLDNPRVRQAFNYAVDKPRRLRSANGRIAAANGLIPPFVPGYNPTVKGYPCDPRKARVLLEESGVAQPIRLTLWHGLDLDSTTIAQGVQSDLQDIGVQIDLKPVTITELVSAATIRGKVQMALTGWVSPIPDPKDILCSVFDGRAISNTSTMNFAFYSNPEVDRLFDEASTNLIPAARYALYQRAEELIVRDAPVLLLGHPNVAALKQPWIRGILIEPLWPFRLDRVWRGQ